MNTQHHPDAAPAGAALLSLTHLPLATRLAVGAGYGIAAGLLLHDHARIAAIAMVAIWLATVWRGSGADSET